MSDFLKIWKLEFRRQRFLLRICLGIYIILTIFLVLNGRVLIDGWPGDLFRICFFSGICLCAFLVSVDPMVRDFQQGNLSLQLSLPISAGKLFRVKYTYSLFVFCCFISAALLCAVLCPGMKGMFQYGVDFLWMCLALLFFAHSVFWLWGLLFRDTLGGLTGLAAFPVTIIFVSPLLFCITQAAGTIEYDYEYGFAYWALGIAFILLWGIHLLFAQVVWTRIADSRSMKVVLIFCLILLLVPLMVWGACQGVWLRRYLNALERFESYIGNSGSGDRFSVPAGVMEFGYLNSRKGIETAMQNLFQLNGVKRELPAKNASLYCIENEKVYKELLWEMERSVAQRNYRSLPVLAKAVRRLDLFYSGIRCITLPKDRFFDVLLAELPCTKETIPVLEEMIRILEGIPDGRKIHNLWESTSLAPGVQLRGWKRMSEILKKSLSLQFGVIFFDLKYTLKNSSFQMYLRELSAETEIAKNIAEFNSCKTIDDLFRVSSVFWKEEYASRSRYETRLRFFTVMKYRLRKYFLEHGTLTDKASDLLTAQEIEVFEKNMKLLLKKRREWSQKCSSNQEDTDSLNEKGKTVLSLKYDRKNEKKENRNVVFDMRYLYGKKEHVFESDVLNYFFDEKDHVYKYRKAEGMKNE